MEMAYAGGPTPSLTDKTCAGPVASRVAGGLQRGHRHPTKQRRVTGFMKSVLHVGCGSATIERNPKRGDLSSGRITLTCKTCSRCAVYLARGAPPSPEEPRKMMK